jgi:hypothetical protein
MSPPGRNGLNGRTLLLDSAASRSPLAALRGSGRTGMKAFLLSVVVVIALAVIGYVVVAEFQRPAEEAFARPSARI